MSRFLKPWLLLAGALVVGVGAVPRILKITPSPHNFGQMVVGGTVSQVFVVDYATPTLVDSLVASIGGRDAADFSVVRTLAPTSLNNRSGTAASCFLLLPRVPSGFCYYEVAFRPTSVGKKSATLDVRDSGGRISGTLRTAALQGEGVFSCRTNLVPCNYASFYSGFITLTTLDASVASVDRMERLVTTIRVSVDRGVAICTGTQDDVTEDRHNGIVRRHSTSAGPISGPGLFAVEFKPVGGGVDYTISFACPTASLTHAFTDYEANTSGKSSTPAEPAKWNARLSTDDWPTSMIGDDLDGTQLDPTSDPVNDKAGHTKLEWSLKKS